MSYTNWRLETLATWRTVIIEPQWILIKCKKREQIPRKPGFVTRDLRTVEIMCTMFNIYVFLTGFQDCWCELFAICTALSRVQDCNQSQLFPRYVALTKHFDLLRMEELDSNPEHGKGEGLSWETGEGEVSVCLEVRELRESFGDTELWSPGLMPP